MDQPLFNFGLVTAFGAPLALIYGWRRTAPLWLIRSAIALAIVIPIAFLALITAVYLLPSNNPAVMFDYAVNLRAAGLLYSNSASNPTLSPYSVPGAYSFPVPTFWLVHALAGFGSLLPKWGWVTWWIVNSALWLCCAVLCLRFIPPPNSQRMKFLRRYIAVAIPGFVVLWQGQTALFILSGLLLLHVGLTRPSLLFAFIGGSGLAVATLIKPQIGLIALGLATHLISTPRERSRIFAVGISALVVGMGMIGASLILPGGVTLETYRTFFSSTLGAVAQPAAGIIIGSPSYLAAWIAYQLGLPQNIGDLASSLTTLAIIALALVDTTRRVKSGAAAWHIALLWAGWAIVSPRVAWTWYSVWLLPLLIIETDHAADNRLRLTVIISVITLCALQLSNLWIAALTVFGLIYLLLTATTVTDKNATHNTAQIK